MVLSAVSPLVLLVAAQTYSAPCAFVVCLTSPAILAGVYAMEIYACSHVPHVSSYGVQALPCLSFVLRRRVIRYAGYAFAFVMQKVMVFPLHYFPRFGQLFDLPL